jgi:hypothetical protein
MADVDEACLNATSINAVGEVEIKPTVVTHQGLDMPGE